MTDEVESVPPKKESLLMAKFTLPVNSIVKGKVLRITFQKPLCLKYSCL
ncbi:MAG: hypothetical protein CM15mP93_09490 [Thiotrichaceae bacterium]|nr:MAG: hypothetical protein CM15mP93_09490 [Thiotrichaceae bacterium]